MHRGLHGRGALFDTDPPGLALRLVGLRPYQLRSNPYEHPKELPFVVFAGGRGLGKSAVLRELRDAYRGHTPVALIDGEERQFAGPPAERPAESWSPVGQALTTIAEQLAEPVTGAGRIGFPRLTSGLLAVAAGGWSDRDVPRIRQEAERILLLNETGSWLSGFAGRWVSKVISKLIASLSGTGPVIAPIIEATLEAFAEGIGPAPRRLRRAATWYRDYPNAGGNPKLGLILLSSHFRAAWRLPHPRRALSRTGPAGRPRRRLRGGHAALAPAGPPGRADRQRAGTGGPRPDGTGAARPRRRHRRPRRLLRRPARVHPWSAAQREPPHPPRGSPARRLREPGTSPSSRALLVALPPLTPDDTLHLVGGVSQGLAVPPQLPHATHRLSGGSPLGVTLLAESARQNLPQGAKSLGELLTSDVAVHEDNDGKPTYQELLDRLVPGGKLDELTVLAAAHDRDSACVLAEVQLSDDFGASGVLALEERLTEEGWTSAAGQFVGDPFLRALLLLRLHHDDPDHARWRSVHRALIDHYGDGDRPDSARYRLHHELALGKADFAVAHLRDTFPRTDTGSWLSSLVFIASAPYYHAHDPDGRDFGGHGGHDDRAAVALGRTDAAQQPPDSVDAVLHLRVRRLLHAVWQLTDPLVLPDPKVSDRLRFELEQLSNLRAAGNPAVAGLAGWPSDALMRPPPAHPW